MSTSIFSDTLSTRTGTFLTLFLTMDSTANTCSPIADSSISARRRSLSKLSKWRRFPRSSCLQCGPRALAGPASLFSYLRAHYLPPGWLGCARSFRAPSDFTKSATHLHTAPCAPPPAGERALPLLFFFFFLYYYLLRRARVRHQVPHHPPPTIHTFVNGKHEKPNSRTITSSFRIKCEGLYSPRWHLQVWSFLTEV